MLAAWHMFLVLEKYVRAEPIISTVGMDVAFTNLVVRSGRAARLRTNPMTLSSARHLAASLDTLVSHDDGIYRSWKVHVPYSRFC